MLHAFLFLAFAFLPFTKIPFAESAPLPPTCLLCTGKRADVQSDFSLKGSREGFRLLSDSLPFIRAAIRSIHPLCSPRSTPTWPFDVKPPTYEPIGLILTRESSVLFEIIFHQALK